MIFKGTIKRAKALWVDKLDSRKVRFFISNLDFEKNKLDFCGVPNVPRNRAVNPHNRIHPENCFHGKLNGF